MMHMRIISRLMHTTVLLGTGAYFVQLIVSGNLANYVNIRIEWMIVAAATLLWTYGLINLIPRQTESCGCGHAHVSWKALIFIIPLFLGFFLPSKPLGAGSIVDGDIQTMMRDHISMDMLATPERVENPSILYNPLNDLYPERQFSSENPLHFTILDWLRLYADTDKKDALEGQKADVTGFVLHDHASPDGFIVTRFFMRHCMFDTIPIGIAVRWNDADELKEDTWVRVQGVFRLIEQNGVTVPVLQATNVKRVKQPDVPYLYPQTQ